MDRNPGEIDQAMQASSSIDRAAVGLGDAPDYLTVQPAGPEAIDSHLFVLAELEVSYLPEHATLWTMMRPAERPSFTPGMLEDFRHWQRLIAENFGPGRVPLRYLVLGSRTPDVFCFGGDLQLFQQLIRRGDRRGLERYGNCCVEILHRNMHALDLPLLTVGLVQGAALGGGFEALLSFDYIVAEESATFGLPESMFGLFPGMGAHSFLSRMLGGAMADRLIMSSKTYSAREMFELGLVHQLAPDGAGEEVCRNFIRQSERRHAGLVNARLATKKAQPIELEELKAIVALWADAALQLSETDLRLMGRLTRAQARLGQAA